MTCGSNALLIILISLTSLWTISHILERHLIFRHTPHAGALKITQLNTGNCQNTTNLLKRHLDRNKPDIVLIQDVYKNRDNLILKFGSAKILHTRVNDKRIEPSLPHCTGLDNAIIVNNKDLNADLIPEYSNDHITTAHLWWLHGHTRKELIIANIYFRPRAELEPDVELLKELVRDRQWSAIQIGRAHV